MKINESSKQGIICVSPKGRQAAELCTTLLVYNLAFKVGPPAFIYEKVLNLVNSEMLRNKLREQTKGINSPGVNNLALLKHPAFFL